MYKLMNQLINNNKNTSSNKLALLYSYIMVIQQLKHRGSFIAILVQLPTKSTAVRYCTFLPSTLGKSFYCE